MPDDPIPDITPDDIEGDPMDTYDPSILDTPKLLRPTYVPNMGRIVGRDAELTKLESVLKPAAHGDPPGDAAILSKPGTGKTLCAKNVAGRLRALGQQNDVKVVTSYVNCGEDNTETQTAQTLAASANRQLDAQMDIPTSGISTGQYLKRLWELLDAADSFVVVLDEIDKLGTDANNVIKKLADAESDGKACYTGSIVISNKRSFYEDLDPRVKSRFQNNDTELVFGPYNADQLREILHNRTDAFKDGVLSDDVIPLCAAFAGQQHGDARKAIDLLRAAGKHAEATGKPQVDESDVRAVQKQASTTRERELIVQSLSHAQYVLYAIAYLTRTHSDTSFSTGEIRDVYQDICASEAASPQSHNSVLQHLKNWAEVEITENKHTGGGKARGSYRAHRLVFDPDIIIAVVESETLTNTDTRNLP
jgi:cell division control protein 6